MECRFIIKENAFLKTGLKSLVLKLLLYACNKIISLTKGYRWV